MAIVENETKNGDIDLENIDSEVNDAESDTAIFRINTYGADFTLEILSKKLESGEIIIPPFQRKYVWNIKKASKLIESFLLGLPVPQVFLYREEKTQSLLVVDGHQRLRTVHSFFKELFNDSVAFKLKGVKNKWEGLTFNNLEESDKRKLNNYILRANIFEQTDPKDNSSIFEIFERLNTGGMSLTQQEVRNCVIRGNFSDFLGELNNYKNWRKLLNKNQPDTRMKDIEMILRFFALFEKLEEYKAPMKDFITNFMREKQNLDATTKEKYKELFYKSVDLIVTQKIERPFCLRAGINIAIYDSVMVAIAKIGHDNICNLKEKYGNLLKKEKYLDTIQKSTTDTERVKERINIAIGCFKQ